MKRMLMGTSAALAIALASGPAFADMDAAKSFLDKEIGDQSVLSRADQEKEMQWFIDAAKPFAGMEIKVVSETITTHEYESQVLAPAFEKITGIKITHDLIGEGDVVERLQVQMQSGNNVYDAYVNDSDLIGTHWRYGQARNLTEWMEGEGADVTSPTLDLDDFIGRQAQEAPHTVQEIGDVFFRKGVAERQHGHGMRDLGEAFGGSRAHLVGRAVLADQVGIPSLDGRVALAKGIIVGIADFRCVVPVISVVMGCNLAGEALQFDGRVLGPQAIHRLGAQAVGRHNEAPIRRPGDRARRRPPRGLLR